jgi:hypothetical protein
MDLADALGAVGDATGELIRAASQNWDTEPKAAAIAAAEDAARRLQEAFVRLTTGTVDDAMRIVRAHPDFVFGAIFTADDFPGSRPPDDFRRDLAEESLETAGTARIAWELGL